MRGYERVATEIKRVCSALERVEGGRDVFRLPDFRCDDFEAERSGRRLNLSDWALPSPIKGKHGYKIRQEPAALRDCDPAYVR
jgi:hypothetical protein